MLGAKKQEQVIRYDTENMDWLYIKEFKRSKTGWHGCILKAGAETQ